MIRKYVQHTNADLFKINKCPLCRPLKRLVCGMLLAAIAFGITGFLQIKIQVSESLLRYCKQSAAFQCLLSQVIGVNFQFVRRIISNVDMPTIENVDSPQAHYTSCARFQL